ncbi:hypothetical protein [Paenibacillus polymyxa]|uniref:hypothetical protein n=1 Tax=Paenibacillus polymyxa TaxID=1406 RepID=UPI00130E5AAB|nr:hypothetical protein [Paenibacillus polymyxa]
MVFVGGEPKYARVISPEGKLVGKTNTDTTKAWAGAIPNYCTDPAASLEVQAKALEVSYVKYCEELRKVTNPTGKWYSDAIELGASLLGATARQRAEAAYMTLSNRN